MKVTVELEAWVIEMLLQARILEGECQPTIEGRLAYWATDLASIVWKGNAIAQDRVADASSYGGENDAAALEDDDIPF